MKVKVFGCIVLILLILNNAIISPANADTILSGPPPASGKQFNILPVGSTLPSDAECATRIRQTTWEAYPPNSTANQYIATKGSDYDIPQYTGNNYGVWVPEHVARGNEILNRVDGNFTGTTDEILQWAACKWGFDEDMARAQAYVESRWQQQVVGDNGESFGILQVRSATVWNGTFPASQKSTAFNADFAYARWRICYEGLIDYLGAGANDVWGCVGLWFSGQWNDAGSQNYQASVKQELANRNWEQWTGAQVTPRPSQSTPTPTNTPITPSLTPTKSPTPSPTRTPTPTSTPTPVICQTKSTGDANCDQLIDLKDFELWRREFLQMITTKTADFNNDNAVTIADFQIWRTSFLTSI